MTNITGKIEVTPIIGEMSTHYEYVEPLYIDALLKTVIKETTLFTAYPDKMTIETSSGKLRNYIIWGNNTGDYDIETGKYKVPVTVRKINHFDPTSTVVELYPDTDGVVKAATSAKQRSVIVEVDPGTYYTVYINGAVD